MEREGAATTITSVQELIQFLDLGEVRFYELHVTASDEVDPDETAEDEPINASTAYRKRPDGIDYRLKLHLRRPTGEIRVDAAALYAAEGSFEASDEILLDFGDNVAIMALFPYIRQAVSDLGQRVGDHVLLPILPRGAITFDRSQGEDVPGDAAEQSKD